MSTPAPPPVGDRKDGKKAAVEQMFDSIAVRYDLGNRVITGGMDRRWRRLAVALLAPHRPKTILDVATGTADFALDALRLDPDRVVGIDLSAEMLAVGRQKVEAAGASGIVHLEQGDAEHLPFADDTFDAALVGFGVRNFEHLDAGLAEIRRVLRPGAPLVVLEVATPKNPVIAWFYRLYTRVALPEVAGRISGNKGAYAYLKESAQAFPDGEAFLAHLRSVGFTGTQERRLFFGSACIYKALA
ncbi:MAG: ubiquinone/menaquinone biosynthesis methyltransferase [Bacteroidetes bacterium]|nr:ubiquinone/menaquinone biosynthesis methyltransferase [Bacteroidota bacterium]